VIEVTPEKNVVWTFADHRAMRAIASVQLLDVPGDVVHGEILHGVETSENLGCRSGFPA